LGKVEMEIEGDVRPDEGPGIAAVPSDKSVEKNDLEVGVPAEKAFDGPDDVLDPLAAPVDPAVTEDVEGGGGGARVEGVKNGWVHPARGAMAGQAVPTLDQTADALGISEKAVGTADDLAFGLVALEDEIEKFRPGREAVELGKHRVLARQSDVERIGSQGGKGARLPEKGKPFRRTARGMEKGKGMAEPDDFIPDFDITADSPENLDMGKDGRNLHSGILPDILCGQKINSSRPECV
jgi:hypothetical protein